jgi:hypothetical protein
MKKKGGVAISFALGLAVCYLDGCTVPVTIKNDLSKPVPVETSGAREPFTVKPVLVETSYVREPFAAALVVDIPNSGSAAGKAQLIVPGDKRLVIETISMRGGIGLTADIEYVSVTVVTNGQLMSENITSNIVKKVLDDQGVKGLLVSGSQQTRLYADAGSTVTVHVSLTKFPGASGSKQNVWISGYLLPLNSPTLSP